MKKNFLRKAGIVALAASVALTFSVTGMTFADTTSESEAKAAYDQAKAEYDQAKADYEAAQKAKDDVYASSDSIIKYVSDQYDKSKTALEDATKAKNEASDQYYKDKATYDDAVTATSTAKTNYDTENAKKADYEAELKVAQKASEIDKKVTAIYCIAYNEDGAYDTNATPFGTATDGSIAEAYDEAISYEKSLKKEKEDADQATATALNAVRTAGVTAEEENLSTDDSSWTDAQKAAVKAYRQAKAYSDVVDAGYNDAKECLDNLNQVVTHEVTVTDFNTAKDTRCQEDTTIQGNLTTAQGKLDNIEKLKKIYDQAVADEATAKAAMDASKEKLDAAEKELTKATKDEAALKTELAYVKDNAYNFVSGKLKATENATPYLYTLDQAIKDAKDKYDAADHNRSDAYDIWQKAKSNTTVVTKLKKLKTPKSFKVKAIGKSKVKVSWKKVSHASYYRVKVAKKGSMAYKSYKTKKTSKILKLKKGKKYKIRVNACAKTYKNSSTKTKVVKVK